MASPKKIIARTKVDNRYQIGIFKQKKNNKLVFVELLVENASSNSSLFMPSAHANEAEYTGLIIGLEKARELGISKLEIKGDSQTIIYQVSGKYQPKPHSKFLDYRARVLDLLSFFDDYSLDWIPRRKNQLADRAAHKCLKENCPPEEKSYAEEYIDYLIYGNHDWFDDDFF